MIIDQADPLVLSERPGAGRVAMPLAEGSSLGVASGLAIAGRRVLVELVDLAGLDRARDALGDLATLRARSEGAFSAVVVVRVPLAPGDLIPELPAGLRVGVAAGSADEMVHAALGGQDPAVIFECEGPGAGSLGVPRWLRQGADATILAQGAGVATAIEAAAALEASGVQVGVVDLAGVTLGAGLALGGRLVLVGHGLERLSGAAMLAAFWRLEAPPQVLRADASVGHLVVAVNEAMEA